MHDSDERQQAPAVTFDPALRSSGDGETLSGHIGQPEDERHHYTIRPVSPSLKGL